MKVYYDKETGYLCERYPKDIEVKEDTPFIELPEEEVEETYIVEYGKFWAIKDNKLVKVDDVELQATEEYKQEIKNNEIADLKFYLDNTDYVITKLNEAKIEDEELFNQLKTKYSEILEKRKEARARINELEQ
ncbi:MAG: hypothetical protein ACI35S_00455 [Anaeroplasma sp.]